MQYLHTRQKGMGKGRFCHTLPEHSISLWMKQLFYTKFHWDHYRNLSCLRERFIRESVFLAIDWGAGKDNPSRTFPSKTLASFWRCFSNWLTMVYVFIAFVFHFQPLDSQTLKEKENKTRLLLKATQLGLDSLMATMKRPRTTLTENSVNPTNRIITSAPWITNRERVVVQGSPWTWRTVRSYCCSFNNQHMKLSMLFHLTPNSGRILTYTDVYVLQCWMNTSSAGLLLAHCFTAHTLTQ